MQAVETVLNKKIKSELAIAFPNLEVFQENQHGDTPPVEKTGDFSEYVKLTVNYGVPLQDSRVSAKRPGIATVQIFTPLGTGTGRAIEIFQVLQGKLSYVQWAEQALATSSVSFLKVGKTGSHYQSNVDIFFEYAESNI
jgi:hypothetical protein